MPDNSEEDIRKEEDTGKPVMQEDPTKEAEEETNILEKEASGNMVMNSTNPDGDKGKGISTLQLSPKTSWMSGTIWNQRMIFLMQHLPALGNRYRHTKFKVTKDMEHGIATLGSTLLG